MKIHIGEIIKSKLDRSDMSIVGFAKKLNTSRNNVYDIIGRTSIDTDMLYKIGQILDYDFFQHYSTTPTKTLKTKESVLIEMELSDAEIIRLGLNEKIFKTTKKK
jgi:predicted DNA-binding protein YlxM (UPF0122 family)